MAFRTWARLLAVTLGAGALAAASQLGVAYGLGVLRLTRVLDITTRDQWTAQLAWVAWLAAMSAVVGAIAGNRVRTRWKVPSTVGTRLGLAVAAAAGAAVMVPLTMQPARTAQIAGVHPVFVIGICSALGALVGLAAAYAALAQLVARWSLAALGAAVWVLAVVSVAPSLAPSDPLPAVRLGVFDAGFLAPAVTQRTALFTMPALALLIGAALGWAARRREMPTLTIALAGLAGPAVLTLSYLIAGPGSGSERYQVVPYWAAMTATGAGVLGSVLAAVIRRGGDLDPDLDDDADEKTAELAVPGAGPAGASAATGSSAAGPATGSSAAGPATGSSPAGPATGSSPAGPATGSSPAGPATGSSPADSSAGGASVKPADTGVLDMPPRSPAGSSAAGPSDTGGWSVPGPRPGGPEAALSGRSAPIGRRSSAVDAFTGRSGEWPVRAAASTRPDTAPPWAGSRADAPEPAPYVPEPATRPLPPEAIQEPGPARPARGRGRLSFGRRNRAAREETPAPAEVPAPPHRPEIPGVGSGLGSGGGLGSGLGHAEAEAGLRPDTGPGHRSTPGWLAAGESGRSPVDRNEPGRGRSGLDGPGRSTADLDGSGRGPAGFDATGRGPGAGRAPLVPEPHAISAPLPEPEPITPPLPVTPAPEPASRRGKDTKRKKKDDDFVDWVSGLGGE
jgi:hypothetical protein